MGEPGEPAVHSLERSGWDWNHPLYPGAHASACACPGCPLPGLTSVSMGHRDSGLSVLPGGTSRQMPRVSGIWDVGRSWGV